MKVKVFTRDGCVYCPQVKKFLDYKGVQYEEVSAIDNPEYDKMGYATVPVTVYDGLISVGYNAQALTELAKRWKENHDPQPPS